MSDNESIVFLSESDDDDEVKEIPKDDDYDDEEEEEKINPKDIEFTDKRGDNEGGIILQEESFVNDNITQQLECESIAKQDMTTQTEDDLPQNQSENSDSQSTIQVGSSGNKNVASTVSNKDAENKSTTDCRNRNNSDCRSRNNSVTSYSSSAQRQNNTNVNNGPSRNQIAPRIWKPKRMYENVRVQPYNRSNQGGQQNSAYGKRTNHNFANNYNQFGIPSSSYNNFARQAQSVRERYIEQFKEYLRTSFANFLNNTLPFNFPQGYNVNLSQGTSNNFPQGNNNFPQGMNNCPQGINNFPQGINNFPQGNNNFPQGNNNFPQGINNFPQGNNYSPGMSNFPQGNNFVPGISNFPQSNNFQRNN